MKKNRAFKICALILFSLMFLLPLVAAQGEAWEDIQQWLGTFLRIDDPKVWGWGEFLLALVVFVMLFVAFSDIIAGFTAFSTPVAWVLGFGLAVIAAITKGVLTMVHFFMAIAIWAGTLSIFVAIITAFIAFAAIHIGLGKLVVWAKARQEALKAYSSTEKVKMGFRALRGVGEEAAGRR